MAPKPPIPLISNGLLRCATFNLLSMKSRVKIHEVESSSSLKDDDEFLKLNWNGCSRNKDYFTAGCSYDENES
jgi:hypothetical protein